MCGANTSDKATLRCELPQEAMKRRPPSPTARRAAVALKWEDESDAQAATPPPTPAPSLASDEPPPSLNSESSIESESNPSSQKPQPSTKPVDAQEAADHINANPKKSLAPLQMRHAPRDGRAEPARAPPFVRRGIYNVYNVYNTAGRPSLGVSATGAESRPGLRFQGYRELAPARDTAPAAGYPRRPRRGTPRPPGPSIEPAG